MHRPRCSSSESSALYILSRIRGPPVAQYLAEIMKFPGVFFLVAFAGLRLSQAQNGGDVADCNEISVDLGTTPIDPATGKAP